MSRILVALAIAASICAAQTDPFQSQVNISAGDGTGSLALADYNGDGKMDIAVMNPLASTITVLLGDGKGGFSPAPGGALHLESWNFENEPLAAADFDGDGKMDLAYTEHAKFNANTRLTVSWGKGDGTFLPGTVTTQLASSLWFDRLVVGDLNGDGKLDVVANMPNSGTRGAGGIRLYGGRLFLGNGTGTFTANSMAWSVAFGDLNQDGRIDFVNGDNSSGPVTNLANATGGFTRFTNSGFTPVFNSSTPGDDWASQIEVVDYDHDGFLDLFVTTINSRSGTLDGVYAFRGGGTGQFFKEFRFAAVQVDVIATGDFDGDGVTDWAVAGGGIATVGLVRLPASFARPITFNYEMAPVVYEITPIVPDIRTADFDGDGKSDLVISNGRDLLLLTTGPQPPRSSQKITLAPIPDRSVNSAAFVPTVSASSGLPVTIQSETPKVCTVAANVVTLLSGGTCLLQANQPGDASTKPAPSAFRAFNVSLVPQKITVVPIGPVQFGGSPVRVQAVASSGLPLTYSTNGLSSVCSVNGPVITFLRVGSCQAGIQQPGSTFYASTFESISIEVTGGQSPTHVIDFPPLADLPLSQDSTQIGSPISSSGYQATLTSDTPTICAVDFVYSYSLRTLDAGTCSITASLHPSYPWAPPVTRTFTVLPVEKLPQTISTTASANYSLAAVSSIIFFSATLGNVTVVSNSPSICSFNNPTIRFLAVGVCSLTGTHPGNVFYLPASRTITFNIVDGPTQTQTVALPPVSDLPLGTQPFSIATIGSSLPTIVSNTPGVCSVVAGTVSLLATGTCSITASRPGTSIVFPAQPVTRTFNVTAGNGSQAQSINFSIFGSGQVGGPPVTLSATATSGLPVTFVSETPAICSVSGNAAIPLSAGTCVISATQSGNSVFASAPPHTASFSVRNATLQTQTITFPVIANLPLGSPSFVLPASASSGLPITYQSFSSACRISGNIVTLTSAGSCSITARQDGNGIYGPAFANGSFTVLPLPLAPPSIRSVLNGASAQTITLARSAHSRIVGEHFLVAPVVKLRDKNGTEFTLEQLSTEDSEITMLVASNAAIGAAALTVTNANGTAAYPVVIDTVSPGLISADGSGVGPASGEIVVTEKSGRTMHFDIGDRVVAIAPGSDVTLTLDATGVRGDPNSFAITIDQIPAQILAVRAHPTILWLDQVTVNVPQAALGNGTVNIVIASPSGTVYNTVTAGFGGSTRSPNSRRR